MPVSLQDALNEELGRVLKCVLPAVKSKTRRKKIHAIMHQAHVSMQYTHVGEMVAVYKRLIDIT